MASDFMMPSLSGFLCAGGSRFSPELRQVLQGVSVLYTVPKRQIVERARGRSSVTHIFHELFEYLALGFYKCVITYWYVMGKCLHIENYKSSILAQNDKYPNVSEP